MENTEDNKQQYLLREKMDNEQLPIPQTQSIKLMKMSKGYNWEIRILDLDIEKLEKLDLEMRMKFGGMKNED